MKKVNCHLVQPNSLERPSLHQLFHVHLHSSTSPSQLASRFPPITLWKSMLSNGAKIWTTMLSFGLCMQSWLCMEMLTLITMKSLLPHVVDSIIIFLTYLRDRLVYVAKRACIPRAGGSPKNTRTWLVLHIQFRCSESDSRGSAEGGYSLNS